MSRDLSAAGASGPNRDGLEGAARRNRAAQQLLSTRLIGVIRCEAADSARALVEVFLQAGLRLVELTLTIPGALELLAELRGRAAVDGACLGAGTVLTESDARAAVSAGAEFLVSPITDPAVIAVARAAGALAIPGAGTANEVAAAWRDGADIVKLYPAPHLGGPAYLRTLRGPFPHIPLLPTGGSELRIEQIAAYAEAGAVAVGLGQGALLDPAGEAATRHRIAGALEIARRAWKD
ncbi:MAG TPA: bifunctional 4-hydroxy-2-oxoglutarate aldolase/2-dehydro-3-deoxy-phosphogluconate aldolase [Acidobacteriota bacterium]